MTLDFQAAAPARAPAARSPLGDAATGSGATLEERDGWLVAASFGDPAAERAAIAETVGFADRSQLTKLELQGAPGAIEAALTAASGWCFGLTPTRALLLSEPGAAIELDESALRSCDLTGSLAALTIAGPAAREVIARFCALDLRERSLPVGGFRPGSVARTPGYLLREADERFLILFGAAYGAYLWEVVADAAARLGGRPVGLDALVGTSEEAQHA